MEIDHQEDTNNAAMDDDVQTLPPTLSSQLVGPISTRFHPAAASRLMIIDGASTDTDAQTGDSKMIDFACSDVVVGQMNQLLHAWHAIFCQLQVSATSMNPRLNPAADLEQWHTHLLSVSRMYRAELDLVLHAASKEMQQGSVKKELRQELKEKNIALEDYKYQLILIETCKSLFHLLEIFYLDPHLNLTFQLIDWIHRTLLLPQVELTEEEVAEGYDPDVMHDTESYWIAVYRRMLQGRLYEALQLLQSCEELTGSDSSWRGIMRKVFKVIESVPAIVVRDTIQAPVPQTGYRSSASKQHVHIPLEQFHAQLSEWRDEVRAIQDEMLENPETQHMHLDMLLSILLGDETSMLECAGVNYLEYFIATLIYITPTQQHSKGELAATLGKCMEQCEQRWREDRKHARQEAIAAGEVLEDTDENDLEEEESLYTPLDTLRFHLISSDITSAINVMQSMIDLKFFLAHVVHLLHQHGEILHLEPADSDTNDDITHGLPLRLNHSSVADNITLVEHYLISFGESLESAAHATHTGQEDFYLLAAVYYASCPEHGRGYLVNLIRKQSLTLTLVAPQATQQAPSAFGVQPTASSAFGAQSGSSTHHSSVPLPILHTRKIHKLLSLCSRYDLPEEISSILLLAGSTCARLGFDALRAEKDSSLIPQAAFWFSMLPTQDETTTQDVDQDKQEQQRGVSSLTLSHLESLAERLLDELLLRSSENSPRRLQLASEALRGVLAHTPDILVRALDSLDLSAGASPLGEASPLLSFAQAFHDFGLFTARMHQAARDVEQEKQRLLHEASFAPLQQQQQQHGDGDMADVFSPSTGRPFQSGTNDRLAQLLAVHEYTRAQSLTLLSLSLQHAPLLIGAQRKYWLVLISRLIELADANSNGSGKPNADAIQQQYVSWYDLSHPSVQLPAILPSPAASPLTLASLTHVQRLLSAVTLSSTADLYAKVVGGSVATKRIQARLSAITQQCIAQGNSV